MSKKLDQSLVDAYASIYEARRGHAAGSSDLEKQASQLASDVRYKAKGKVKEGTNREELKKIYLGLIQSSPAPNVVKQMAKKKLVGESYIPEEGYDIARDMGMVKPSKDKKDATTMPRSSTKREKENLDNKKKGDEALDSVISSLRKKYGKNAVMDMSKKKVKEDVDPVSEEKKELPTTKMYRKAGNLSRKALSKGLDSKEGSKAQKRSEKIVSTISREKERERFDKMTTPKAQLRNEELIDELNYDTLTNYVRKADKDKKKDRRKGIGMAKSKQDDIVFGKSKKNKYGYHEEYVDEKKLVHGTYGNFVSGQKSEKKSDKPMTPDQRYKIPEGKMDPVGQEDGDINNDGKKDGTDKYLSSRRKAIGKAIAKKRGRVKEGFSAWRVDLDFQEQVKK